MSDGAELTIGEVARRAGVATSQIRYYESIGLLPEPDRLYGQRRYDTDVLGRLAFTGVAQSAGFRAGRDQGVGRRHRRRRGPGGAHPHALDSKLDEVEALLERTRAMKGWLEVAQQCGCATPEECALFPTPGYEPFSLALVRVEGQDCRRPA